MPSPDSFWWAVLFLFPILILIAWDSNQRIGVGWHSESRLAGFGLGWKLPVPSVVCLSSGNCSSPPLAPRSLHLRNLFLLPWLHILSLNLRGWGTAYQQVLLFGKPGFFVNTLIPLFSLNSPGVCCRSICSVIFHLITVDISFSHKQDNAMEGHLCKERILTLVLLLMLAEFEVNTFITLLSF